MANGRPGDSILHDILHHGREVFGPACDGLVRDIAARLPPGQLGALRAIIEPWPFGADGQPLDSDALFHRLAALRDGLGPVRADVAPEAAAAGEAEAPAAERRGSALRAAIYALLGFFLGGPLIGLLAGVVLFTYGEVAKVSKFEGAFAMGVAAAMPVIGFAGGLVLAAWLGWRGWRGGR
jgi:hypothetical protein